MKASDQCFPGCRLILFTTSPFGENKHWESKIAEIEGILFHVMSCKRYLISKRLLKRNNSCVVLSKWTGK